MAFDGKPLSEVTQQDIDALVVGKVREGRDLDYKAALPGRSEGDRKEFLADVTAFANSGGGHLVFGVRETGGVPEAIEGVAIPNVESETLGLEGTLRDGVDPRIPGVQIRAVVVGADRYVLLVRIPRSWSQPHMVTLKGSSRFFARNSAGKYQLDVGEIRSAFLMSDSAPRRIRDLRAQRLNKVLDAETPIEIPEGPIVLLHLVPLSSGGIATQVPVSTLTSGEDVRPMSSGSYGGRHNFDGYLVSSEPGTYVQVFRDGAIEALDGRALCYARERGIASIDFERQIIEGVQRYLRVQRKLGVAPPVVAMLSLLGVKGLVMALDQNKYWRDMQHAIDRDQLIVPDVLATDFDVDVGRLMKPVFDAVWNAAGIDASLHYDRTTGAWNAPR